MHTQALLFARDALAGLTVTGHVVEIGSRNINGSIRQLIDWRAYSYIGVDVQDGPCVDIVADGATFIPREAPDLIVCMETLEHAEQAAAIVRNAAAILRPGGRLLITCATDPRAPHSGVDGGPLHDGEFYRNVPPTELVRWVADAGLQVVGHEVHADRGDLYLVAERLGGIQDRTARRARPVIESVAAGGSLCAFLQTAFPQFGFPNARGIPVLAFQRVGHTVGDELEALTVGIVGADDETCRIGVGIQEFHQFDSLPCRAEDIRAGTRIRRDGTGVRRGSGIRATRGARRTRPGNQTTQQQQGTQETAHQGARVTFQHVPGDACRGSDRGKDEVTAAS